MSLNLSLVRKVVLVIILTTVLLSVSFFSYYKKYNVTKHTSFNSQKLSVRSGLSALPLEMRSLVAENIGASYPGYDIERHGSSFITNNPRHHYEATWSDQGLSVDAGELKFRIALQGQSYQNPTVLSNRLEYQRNGIKEWYINSPFGVEQGFTISNSLQKEIALAISGNIVTHISADKKSVVISSSQAVKQISYGGLYAYDAHNKKVPAWFEQKDSEIVIRTNDHGAIYPITIDPYIEEQTLTSGDGAASDNFGDSVAINSDGTRIVVGAYGASGGTYQGAAYVYSRSGTTWTQEQKLVASDGASSELFGIGVAIDDSSNRIIVGSAFATVGGNSSQGAAYVYSRSGTTWTQEQKLTASDGAAGDNFGWAVDINGSGDRIAIGAQTATVSTHSSQGAAYVYSRSGTTWTQEQKLTASDGAAGDNFGYAVSFDDTASRIVVGAYKATINLISGQGAAYVYSRSGTTWTQEQKLASTDATGSQRFGNAAAMDSSGARVVVGAYLDDSGSIGEEGSAYVYSRSGTTWTQEQKLTASDSGSGDDFGTSLDIDDDGTYIIVGAPNDDIDANSNQGSAYVFSRSGTTWTQDQKLTASNGASGDAFGIYVAINSDGTRMVSGAYTADVSAVADQGAAYVIQHPTPTPTPTPTSTAIITSGGGGPALELLYPFKAPLGGVALNINNSATKTTNRSVNLKLYGGPDARRMAISRDVYFSDASQEPYQPYAENIPYDLCGKKLNCPLGTYTIYARFYNGIYNPSKTVSATIKFVNDKEKTSVTISPAKLSMYLKNLSLIARTLSLGSIGNDVRFLQQFLATNPLWYPEGRVTGYFGELTKNAVINFQHSYGLIENGKVDSKTLKVLKSVK